MHFKLLLAFTDDTKTNAVMKAAREAGATGATVMIGGFGEAGSPIELIHALIDHGAGDLTVINNNTGNSTSSLSKSCCICGENKNN